ncbi:helix-turn-helix domain-containing protein [Microbacterium terrisoli]|uniref:AraC-like ligand-binding domain-containing protein n=1 Tax=Microbacterium terrisoli TaxID=3242192 RepID=UPI0028045A06|nr:helix-turn-helix domain-containing protein [Microbacterium protaetiae]
MGVAGREVQVFDASAVEPADRFDAWREAVDAAFVPLRASAHSVSGYQGALLAQDLGETVTATQVGGSPVTVWRDRATIALSDPGIYKLGLQLHGYCVLSQDGREAALTPGDLAIYDTTRPYVLDFAESYQMFVLLIPHDRLGLTVRQVSHLTAERISGRKGLGALTSGLLTQLGAQMREGGADAAPRAVDAIVELVHATLSERLGASDTLAGASTIMSATTAWIDQHLRDPDLTVEEVALAQHVSVRYLQKLFADHETTPSAWIRHRRLQRCQTDLLDPALSTHPAAAIGARWGFTDASAFTRTFKANTGATPGQYRVAGASRS